MTTKTKATTTDTIILLAGPGCSDPKAHGLKYAVYGDEGLDRFPDADYWVVSSTKTTPRETKAAIFVMDDRGGAMPPRQRYTRVPVETESAPSWPDDATHCERPASDKGGFLTHDPLLRLLKALRSECDGFAIAGWGDRSAPINSALTRYNIVKEL